MRRHWWILLSLLVVLPSAGADAGRVPGAVTTRVCGAAGPFWPTETLALFDQSAFVACKEQSRVMRVDLVHRRVTGSVALRGPAIAVTTGFGAVWALDSGGMLYRIQPATSRVTK